MINLQNLFGINLAYPEKSIFFVFLLFAILLIFITSIHRKKIFNYFKLSKTSKYFSYPHYRKLKILLTLIGFCLLVFGYMGPQWGEKQHSIKASGVDICLALDLSQSMMVGDINPNRLEQAKNQLTIFLPELSAGDRTSLIVFSGNAYTVVPLTVDHQAVVDFLSPLNTNFISDQTTNIMSGIEHCFKSLELDEVNDQTELLDSAAKIIILISDGENQSKDSNNTLKKAEKLGVPIYTMALGTKKGGQVPDPLRPSQSLVDSQGNVAISKLQDEFLKKVSKKTGGKIFYASNGIKAWRDFQDSIKQYKQKSRDAGTKLSLEHRFIIFILLAWIILFVEWIIPETKGRD